MLLCFLKLCTGITSGEGFITLQLCFLQGKLTVPVICKEVVKILYDTPEAVNN